MVLETKFQSTCAHTVIIINLINVILNSVNSLLYIYIQLYSDWLLFRHTADR